MPDTPGDRTALERALGRPSVALAFYFLLSVVSTLPLALRFKSAIPAGSGDVLQNYWNFWWWKTALFELGVHPYRSEYLFHPFGTDLVFHPSCSPIGADDVRVDTSVPQGREHLSQRPLITTCAETVDHR